MVSNDSDLNEPICLVRHELGHQVGNREPHPMFSQALLRTQPGFTTQIRQGALAVSQFPGQVWFGTAMTERDGKT